jgi:isocitrate dehydrogenase (NAD+)
MLLCAARMLKHVNLPDYSKRLQESVERVILDGKVKTRDLGGYASTSDFTRAIISNLHY